MISDSQSRAHINRSASQIHKVRELKPKTKEVHMRTRRVYFNRRYEMRHANIVVIALEGVLGDVYKPNFWDDDLAQLYLRYGTP